jgi:hypothetical protein
MNRIKLKIINRTFLYWKDNSSQTLRLFTGEVVVLGASKFTGDVVGSTATI